MMSIWQDMVDDHGFASNYACVQRFVRKLRIAKPKDAHPIIITPPGEEAQVDYGTGPLVRHPDTGKYRRTRLFVMTLGCSRKSVWLLSFLSSSRIWAKFHERAFRRFGGCPKVVVLDNLREGVLKPDIYEPELNPLFRDVLKHYDVVALPCRVRDPDRKGKVESGVNHGQMKIRGKRFESLDDAQDYYDHWTTRWADTRIHGTTKQQVSAMFADEKPHLKALPIEPFRYYEHGTRVVHDNGMVEVGGAYYGAPPGMIKTEVIVQWNDSHVRILDPENWNLLREHLKQHKGGYRRAPCDRPKNTPSTSVELLGRAEKKGKSIGVVCKNIHEIDGSTPGDQRIRGIFDLIRKHGVREVEHACTFALESNLATHRFVRRYLEHVPTTQIGLRQIDPLIRELSVYRDHIAGLTQ